MTLPEAIESKLAKGLDSTVICLNCGRLRSYHKDGVWAREQCFQHNMSLGFRAAKFAILKGKPMSLNVDAWIDSIIRDVAEIPDRNSPDNSPEIMLVTSKELRAIIVDRCTEIGLEIE